jgi:hypothetical protein
MYFDEVIALRKAFETVKERQKKDIPPDLDEKKIRLKKIRESSVGNEDFLNQAIKRLETNGIKVFPAKSKEEALALIMKEIGSEKLVVKSKSNVTKEIDPHRWVGIKGHRGYRNRCWRQGSPGVTVQPFPSYGSCITPVSENDRRGSYEVLWNRYQ